MQKMNCQGNLIVLDGVAGNSITEERFQGLEKAIKECSDPSQIKILARYPSDWAYDKGKLSTERALAAYPKIDGVWSQGGAMTQGAIEAFQAAHRPLAPMTGEDNNGFLKIWQKLKPDGFTSCAGSEPTWEGAIALVFALRALQGEPVPKGLPGSRSYPDGRKFGQICWPDLGLLLGQYAIAGTGNQKRLRRSVRRRHNACFVGGQRRQATSYGFFK